MCCLVSGGHTMTPSPGWFCVVRTDQVPTNHTYGSPEFIQRLCPVPLVPRPFPYLVYFLEHRSHICTTRAVQTPGSLLPKQVHSWSSVYTWSPKTWAAWTWFDCSITHMPSTELGQQERGATALSTLLGLRLFLFYEEEWKRMAPSPFGAQFWPCSSFSVTFACLLWTTGLHAAFEK